MLGKAFRHLWFVYSVTIFVVVIILAIPVGALLHILPGKWARRALLFFTFRMTARTILCLMGIRLQISGKSHLQPGQQYIVLTNHSAALDILVTPASAPILFRSLGKAGTDKLPLIGSLLKKLIVYIDRKNPDSRAKGIQHLKQTLEDDLSVQVYPEGSRNRTDQKLTQFYDGAFRIAIETQTPIITQTLVGMRKIMSPNRPNQFSPGRIHIHWSPPIETSGLTMEDLPKLKEQTREQMLQHLNGES